MDKKPQMMICPKAGKCSKQTRVSAEFAMSKLHPHCEPHEHKLSCDCEDSTNKCPACILYAKDTVYKCERPKGTCDGSIPDEGCLTCAYSTVEPEPMPQLVDYLDYVSPQVNLERQQEVDMAWHLEKSDKLYKEAFKKGMNIGKCTQALEDNKAMTAHHQQLRKAARAEVVSICNQLILLVEHGDYSNGNVMFSL